MPLPLRMHKQSLCYAQCAASVAMLAGLVNDPNDSLLQMEACSLRCKKNPDANTE